jgi:hypothetical protein
MTLPARAQRIRRGGGISARVALAFLGIATLAAGSVAYLLQPPWPGAPAPIDAPPLPIMVAGVVFNVPPAAFRCSVAPGRRSASI